MSKKIELTPEETQECLILYNEELMGSPSISEKMGYHKKIIIRTLKENGVEMGSSGRRNIGGKKVANKKWVDKNKPHLSDYHKDWSKENRDKLRDYHSEWRDDNRDHVRQYGRNYERKRRAETLSID